MCIFLAIYALAATFISKAILVEDQNIEEEEISTIELLKLVRKNIFKKIFKDSKNFVP